MIDPAGTILHAHDAEDNITETISKSLNHIKTKWCLINPITTIPFMRRNEIHLPVEIS